MVLISEKGKELQDMVESLNKASRLAGLEMNLSKTMVMSNNTRVQIYADNEPLKYIYLAKKISFDRLSNY